MSELIVQDGPRALQLKDDELIPVLRSGLYPGASDQSIKLVIGYCRASNLDPMQKPVHLVPMRVKKVGGGKDDYEWRDVVMPGIGLYRTQAARTEALAGIDEPVFGEPMPMPCRPNKVVPKWCRLTVYRMIGGQKVAFTALEFWEENYATAGKDSEAPNSMWARRPYGQIAKCAEAQALRKAFPELGSQPTADETILDVTEIDVSPGPSGADAVDPNKVGRKAKPASATRSAPIEGVAELVVGEPAQPDPAPERKVEPPATPADKPTAQKPATLVGEGEIAYLKNKAFSLEVKIEQVLEELGGLVLDKLTKEDFATVKAHLRNLEA